MVRHSSSIPLYNSKKYQAMIRYSSFALFAAIGLTLYSCEDYNRPTLPSAQISTDQATQATHTIAQLKDLYSGSATRIDAPVVVEATISSDDSEGNLYRNAFIQDETGGIELKIIPWESIYDIPTREQGSTQGSRYDFRKVWWPNQSRLCFQQRAI